MVELTMSDLDIKVPNALYDHLPKWFTAFSNACLLVAGVGILAGLILTMTGLDFAFYKLMAIGCYSAGVTALGLYLAALSFCVLCLNRQHKKENLPIFSINNRAEDDEHGYGFTQFANLCYMTIGVGLTGFGFSIGFIFCC